MQDEPSDIGHSYKSESAENTSHCSSPLFSSSNLHSLPSQPLELLPHKAATATGCSWMGRCSMHLHFFSRAGIFQSSKGITSQRGKATGVSPFMGNRASVAFIKQTERGTQGLRGIIDYRWIVTNYHPRNSLSFAIKESEAQVGGQDSGQWSTNLWRSLILSWWKRSCKAGCQFYNITFLAKEA